MGKCAFRSPDGRRCVLDGPHTATHHVEDFVSRPDRSPGHYVQPDWEAEVAAQPYYGGEPQTGENW